MLKEEVEEVEGCMCHQSLSLWQHHDANCLQLVSLAVLPCSYAGQLRQHKEKGHLIPETEFHIKDERVKVSYLFQCSLECLIILLMNK